MSRSFDPRPHRLRNDSISSHGGLPYYGNKTRKRDRQKGGYAVRYCRKHGEPAHSWQKPLSAKKDIAEQLDSMYGPKQCKSCGQWQAEWDDRENPRCFKCVERYAAHSVFKRVTVILVKTFIVATCL